MALLNGMLDGSAICLVFALTLLVIRPVFASGGAFQPTGAEREARVRLYNDLMSSPILQNQLVPLSQESPVEVRVMLNVYKILEIIEPRQVINMAVYYEFEWKDEGFMWNPADYANVSEAYLPYDRAWHPELIVANSAAEDFSLFPKPEYLQVKANGVFDITGGAIVHTHCYIDLTFFPFDHQTCTLIIGLLGHDIQVVPIAIQGELIEAVAQHVAIPAEWQVRNHSFTVGKSDNFPRVEYTVELDRASIYYLLCVLGPMAATSQLTLLVFWIPPASGERISFLMSIYVSTTLYLGFVGDTLPRKAYTFTDAPRMVLFMVFSIIECILVLIATIISMHMHAAEQKTVHNRRKLEKEEIQRELQGELNKEGMSPRQRNVNVMDLTVGEERLKEDKIHGDLSKVCFGENPSSEENRNQPTGGKERDRSKEYLVGTLCRKRRLVEKLSRYLAKRTHLIALCESDLETTESAV
ncbi:hypothetical protein RRG08_045155 [Elysia crispata]|uniref:Uncharacterized protein n=1 Tax=Elysia crispata TaxID=231223 RepID=A0AAE1A568_9GAST|nr:hypothetical protein RRG08_045155 [Elysia crispata]